MIRNQCPGCHSVNIEHVVQFMLGGEMIEHRYYCNVCRNTYEDFEWLEERSAKEPAPKTDPNADSQTGTTE